MRYFFYAFFIVFTLSSASIAADIADTPPKLLTCPTKDSCARTPEEFEHFVADFYHWYLAALDNHLALDKNKRAVQKNMTDAYLQQALHPKLLQWQKISYDYESPDHLLNYEYYSYCTPQTDIIFCRQDTFESWKMLSTRLIGLDTHGAVVLVSLPAVSNHSDKVIMPHLLSVTLVPYHNVWHILSVQDLISDYPYNYK